MTDSDTPRTAEEAMRLAYPIGTSGTERSAFMRGWQARGLTTIQEAEAAQPVPLDVRLLAEAIRLWYVKHGPNPATGSYDQPQPGFVAAEYARLAAEHTP